MQLFASKLSDEQNKINDSFIYRPHLLYLFTAAAGRPSVLGDKAWTRSIMICLSSGVKYSCSETSAAVSFKTSADRV